MIPIPRLTQAYVLLKRRQSAAASHAPRIALWVNLVTGPSALHLAAAVSKLVSGMQLDPSTVVWLALPRKFLLHATQPNVPLTARSLSTPKTGLLAAPRVVPALKGSTAPSCSPLPMAATHALSKCTWSKAASWRIALWIAKLAAGLAGTLARRPVVAAVSRVAGSSSKM